MGTSNDTARRTRSEEPLLEWVATLLLAPVFLALTLVVVAGGFVGLVFAKPGKFRRCREQGIQLPASPEGIAPQTIPGSSFLPLRNSSAESALPPAD